MKGRDERQQVVRWERFLPRRSLRVLLVEHDDSTRHLVSALLNNCSYRVAAVADGLKAWEILKDKTYTFDLVLTEVDMPLLSGISLLSRIMGCQLSKHIPVIMMSSHDSVSVVYNCMLKGAVDFLVKPVRRNELRNLWQHVWRKHCLSTPDAPESINMRSKDMSAQNGMKRPVQEISDIESKNEEMSRDESDTQSSGSKPHGDNHDEVHGGHASINCISLSATVESNNKEPNNSNLVPEDEPKIHDCGMDRNKMVELQAEQFAMEKYQEKSSLYAELSSRTDHLNKKDSRDGDLRSPAQNSLTDKPSKQIIDFIGAADNGECSYAVLKKDEYRLETRQSFPTTHEPNSDALPSWELSLRRPDLNGVCNRDSQDRHILKHSATSAFSRYCTGISLALQKSEPSLVSSSITAKVCDYSDHVAGKKQVSFTPTWSLTSSQANETGNIIEHQLSCTSNGYDNSGFTILPQSKMPEDECMTKPSEDEEDNNNKNLPSTSQIAPVSHTFAIRGLPFQSLCESYCGMMQPLYYSGSSANGTEKEYHQQSHGLNHHGDHVIYNFTSTSTKFDRSREDSFSRPLERKPDIATNEEPGIHRAFMCSDTEQNNCGFSQDTRDCGRSYGNCGTTDAGCSTGIASESRNENGLQSHERKEFSQDHLRRAAALLKFRQKRKDRCFEKKVRYRSRKKLAEQRPRIKGQFVRQSATVEPN